MYLDNCMRSIPRLSVQHMTMHAEEILVTTGAKALQAQLQMQ